MRRTSMARRMGRWSRLSGWQRSGLASLGLLAVLFATSYVVNAAGQASLPADETARPSTSRINPMRWFTPDPLPRETAQRPGQARGDVPPPGVAAAEPSRPADGAATTFEPVTPGERYRDYRGIDANQPAAQSYHSAADPNFAPAGWAQPSPDAEDPMAETAEYVISDSPYETTGFREQQAYNMAPVGEVASQQAVEPTTFAGAGQPPMPQSGQPEQNPVAESTFDAGSYSPLRNAPAGDPNFATSGDPFSRDRLPSDSSWYSDPSANVLRAPTEQPTLAETQGAPIPSTEPWPQSTEPWTPPSQAWPPTEETWPEPTQTAQGETSEPAPAALGEPAPTPPEFGYDAGTNELAQRAWPELPGADLGAEGPSSTLPPLPAGLVLSGNPDPLAVEIPTFDRAAATETSTIEIPTFEYYQTPSVPQAPPVPTVAAETPVAPSPAEEGPARYGNPWFAPEPAPETAPDAPPTISEVAGVEQHPADPSPVAQPGGEIATNGPIANGFVTERREGPSSDAADLSMLEFDGPPTPGANPDHTAFGLLDGKTSPLDRTILAAAPEGQRTAFTSTSTPNYEDQPHEAGSVVDGFGEPEIVDSNEFLYNGSCGDCPSRWHGYAEAFWLTRESDAPRPYSFNAILNDFDYELGARVEFGRKYDCLDGVEFVYAGLQQWNEVTTAIGPAGALNTTLIPQLGVNLSAFNGANAHRLSYSTGLHNFEANRVWYGWDVISTMIGVRYLNIDEQFNFDSIDFNGDVGRLGLAAENNLYGFQIGGEMDYPSSQRLTVSGSAKVGAFLNAIDESAALVNAGLVQFANSNREYGFSALGEFGIHASYRVTPRLAVRAGYEFWYIYGLGLAPAQSDGNATPLTGINTDEDSDVLYHGGTVGAELTW